MTDTTPRSGMPLLAAAQAQKHVTHNEALLQLDALGCARILDRDLTAPPGSPADGDTYLIHATASGDWTGQDGNVAFALDGGWRFYTPFAGLMAYVVDEAKPIVFDGTAWNDFVSLLSLENLPMLGVNTTADTTNKFAVKSAALLFDNIGNGVQEKLNKNAITDTASILYQTGYSGRAEIGLCGDDSFHFKVSPDGSAWTDALVIDKTSGGLTLAATAKLPAGSVSNPALNFGDSTTGLYRVSANQIGVAINGANLATFSAGALSLARVGGGANITVSADGGFNVTNGVSAYGGSNNGFYTMNGANGTIASPSVVSTNWIVATQQWRAYGNTGFVTCAQLRATVVEPTPSDSAMGARLSALLSPLGGTTPQEVMRFEIGTGFSMFGANPVIDQNRGVRLRSTTISGAITPAVAGTLFYHSDAQNSAGDLAVDTGSAYRHAGQAGLTRLTTDADATYTPRASGRIVRDLATLSADRKLILSTTNVTVGHKVDVSRRGSSGGHNRGVYQADGTTLIVNLADNTSADFIYDATAALWFQK